MLFPTDPFTSLDPRPLGTIKDEDRQEWNRHELATSKEQCAQLRIFAFLAIRGMKEPYGCINTYTQTTELRVGEEAINHSKMC
jgi:hypothetical protein